MTSDKNKLGSMEDYYLRLLLEARKFISTRGTYYYGHEMRGPGADLVQRIDEVLKTKNAA